MPREPTDWMIMNNGIVSSTFLRLIYGDVAADATGQEALVKALGALATAERRGDSLSDEQRGACADAVFRKVLIEADGRLSFANSHVQELAEAWSVVEYLQPDYVDRRFMYDAAIARLGRIGPGAVPLLVELLGDAETSVASGAAHALGEIGAAAVTGIRWAILFGNARVRKYALNALTAMKGAQPLNDELLTLVATVLAEDPNPIVKNAAVVALSDTAHPIAIEALRAAHGGDATTRMLAERALEELGSPEALRALDDARRAPPLPARPPQGVWQIEAPSTEEAPTRTPRVFLSYAKEDDETMKEYRRRLELSGFEVWADSARLVAGERWDERLRFALASSDFVVALISSSTWDGYQRREVEQAISQAADRKESFLVPLFLNRENWRSSRNDWPQGLADVQNIVADGYTNGWTQLYGSLSEAARLLKLSVPARLRSERLTDLTESDVWRMVFDKDFFSLDRNPRGRPLGDEWERVANDTLIRDRATGLIWTPEPVAECDLSSAFGVPRLVRERSLLFASIRFRIPTVEEAMSLMTPATNDEGHHRTRRMKGSPYLLTCDTMPAPAGLEVSLMVWVADFQSADVQPVPYERAWPVWLVASD